MDFKAVQETIQAALVATTRQANQIASEDLSFHRTSNPAVAEELDDASSRLLSLTASLLQSAAKGTDVSIPDLDDADDVEVHWHRIVDVVDTLLEKADTCLDEYTGAIKRKTAPVDHPGTAAKKSRSALDHSLRNANVLKPQNAFERKPNNLDTAPWKPLLSSKPHAITPLHKSLGVFNDETQTTQYKHPYETEILTMDYPESLFQSTEPITYGPIESTAATFVDTYEGVLEMLEELKGATEIAIDTEHHDYRTYSGLLSLMQISTRDKDWIVDTLQPWRHRLEVLNEVFADPKITKVLHGAYMDILWLQRDCGLYIVGLFDTYEAACTLQYPGRGLAYLLKRFVNFDADKKYQLADWRIRPIPEEMLYYARSDTHYLLYIFDRLRNEILATPDGRDAMRAVLDRSKETSLRRHESIDYDAVTGQGAAGWYNLLIKNASTRLTKEQFAVLRAIHQWRDELARKEDESPIFVLSQSTFWDIVRQLPPDPKALHALVGASYLARREVSSLFDIITKAKAQGINGPSVVDVLRYNSSSSPMAIGDVAQKVFPDLKKPTGHAAETKDLVSKSSQLWGDIPMSSRWDPSCTDSKPNTMRFELPWAKFVHSAKLADGKGAHTMDPSSKDEKPTTEILDKVITPEDKEFTLKAGMKRKAPEPTVPSESEGDSESEKEPETLDQSEPSAPVSNQEAMNLEDTDDSDAQKDTKQARKAARKERKRARKEQEEKDRRERKERKKAAKFAKAQAAETEAQDEKEEEPFDYKKAKSVLKPDRSAANGTAGKPQKAKFNPYALTAEGPKPARRMHGEKAGKSQTFKR
ncbi:ribonuclease H-like domain-containing protein [Xylariaceae sp. FL1019]|nr:ribonuclease H-like domain-containing protein [Xylariaceae sp. FL1019]